MELAAKTTGLLPVSAKGVAEAEDGVVAPGREAHGGRRDQCQCPSQLRDEEEQPVSARQLAHLGGDHGLWCGG